MYYIYYLVIESFGEEDSQHPFIMGFAHCIADEEEQQGEEDAEGDLVQAHEFNLHGHGHAINQHAAAHSCNGSIFIGCSPMRMTFIPALVSF